MKKVDVTIVGAGPGGAASALYLLKAGLKPLILEKEPFPRYHIGESLTGECGNCLRELGLEAQMRAVGWPVKYGVTVYGNGAQNSFWVPVQKRNQEKCLEPTSTWQVRRSDFDRMLLEAALARGAELVTGEALAPIVEGDQVTGVRYRTNTGTIQEVRSDVLIDASGQATFLASKSNLTSPKAQGQYDRQVAFFTQVTGAQRDAGEAAGNTLIFTRQPYHWAWFIPLDEQVTSVGIVTPADYFKAQQLSPEEFLRKELYTLNPELSRRLAAITFVEPVRTISNYSYHVRQFTGKGFLCVGDAHRFIDPIFSFGVYFAMKEAALAAQAIQQGLSGASQSDRNPFAAYQALVEQGQDVIQDLLDCFWTQPLVFLIFAHYQYREGVIDLFAGRIYDADVADMPVVKAIRQRLDDR
ncbi:MAG: tryptophan 7-halogenase [Caldilineaceae bacterium]